MERPDRKEAIRRTTPTPTERSGSDNSGRVTSATGRLIARMGCSRRFLVTSGVVFIAFAGFFFGSSASFAIPHVEQAWITLAAHPDTTAASSLLGLASAAKTISFWIAGLTLLIAISVLAATSSPTQRSVRPSQTQRAR